MLFKPCLSIRRALERVAYAQGQSCNRKCLLACREFAATIDAKIFTDKGQRGDQVSKT